ncbi:MAG: sulfotransferase [Actinomycetota bacterium]|nr:sulfotransferase [Actinomycetota bacterium]
MSGFFSAGEIRGLWRRGLIEGTDCSCGTKLTDCDIWARVLARAGIDPLSQARLNVAAEHEQAAKWIATPWLIRGHKGKRGATHTYSRRLASLYCALADVTEARVVVDSSKNPADAAILAAADGVSSFYVHLVRDPRAVAFSWRRRKPIKGGGPRQEMRTYPASRTATRWTGWNLMGEVIRRKNPQRYVVLRYEDFVNDPARALRDILALVNEESELPFVQGTRVKLADHHMVWGNPSRFKRGWIQLKEDDEWIEQLPLRDMATVTALTVPLLRRYGYPILVRKRS